MCDTDKPADGRGAPAAALGFPITARGGTARALRAAGMAVAECSRSTRAGPTWSDIIKNGEVQLVINTPFGKETRSDGYHIRAAAIRHGVTNITTMAGASAAVSAIEAAQRPRVQVHCLQDLHAAAECAVSGDGGAADLGRPRPAVGRDVPLPCG